MKYALAALALILATPASAACTVTDGDTIRCGAERIRMLGGGIPNVWGIDAPEISRPRCRQELQLGLIAKDRLYELLSGGFAIEDSGVRDRYGRTLASLRLSDGRTAGEVLLSEGLAQIWRPGRRVTWC